MLKRLLRVLALLTAGVVSGSVANAAITVEDWRLVTEAGDFVDGPGGVRVVENTVGFPFDLTRTVQAGASRSTSEYIFASTDSVANFHFSFDHVRDGDRQLGGRGDFALGLGSLRFTVSENVAYQISGSYLLAGAPNGMALFTDLISAPTQAHVFWSEQSGAGSNDQHFDVGGNNGTDFNILVGSPSGVLVPGTYLFSYQYNIYAATADNGASATGWLDFKIVPEPGMGSLIAAGATFLLLRRRT